MVSHSLKNKRVLITCGPTWIPLDSMRVISNRSSGALAQSLAVSLAKAGAKVTLIEGAVLRPLESSTVTVIKFLFYDDLLKILRQQLKKKVDIVIHAAAVSDYYLKNTSKRKLRSGQPQLRLTLVPTEKIINSMKRKRPKAFLVGFKLEDKIDSPEAKKKVKKLFREARCDLIVANSLNKNRYRGVILDRKLRTMARATSRSALAKNLIKTLKVNV